MKKTLKLLIPLVLLLALAVAGYWFFFRYRVDVTTGLLRDFADDQFQRGSYSMAIRCYNWADELAPGDTDQTLKLAEAYRLSGNYTKTESTLVRAIQAAPDEARIYERLSQVFVEQDKLLDAQRLLDGVASDTARTALDAARPAAPSLSPAGDFYSEYISVEIAVEAGNTCCCTVNGAYPSLTTDVFAGTVSLPAGDTTIRALAVGENGLVSPLVTERYTVAGVVEDVVFHDPAIEAAMRERLHRENRPIRTDELWDIEELTLSAGMTDTADLPYFTGLKRLVLLDQGELDYSFLARLPELETLELEGCVVTSETLKQIGACTGLKELILADCGVTNVSALSGLTGLRLLDLSGNSIGSINTLVGLTALEELYLGHNALTSLPQMKSFEKLRILDLSYNALTYASSLSACLSVERLNVSHNKLVSLLPLSALTNLVWLNASNNRVGDVSILAPCTGLESFLMTNNQLTEVDFLAGCPKLREVNIDYNDVVAVPAFQADCPLVSFSAAHNFLEDLSGLAGLQALTYVNAEYNNLTDIDVLKDCPALVQVNVYNTNIHDGGVLAEQGVVVNFTPSFS